MNGHIKLNQSRKNNITFLNKSRYIQGPSAVTQSSYHKFAILIKLCRHFLINVSMFSGKFLYLQVLGEREA